MHSPLLAVLRDGTGPGRLQGAPAPRSTFPSWSTLGYTPTCLSSFLANSSPPHVFYEVHGGAKAPVRPDADATPVVVEEDSGCPVTAQLSLLSLLKAGRP